MERGDVLQSLCGSGNIHGPCLDPKTLAPRIETLPPAGTAKRVLRRSALAQYLFSQLRVSPKTIQQFAFPPSRPVAVAAQGEERVGLISVSTEAVLLDVEAVTIEFFTRIKPHVTGQLVIVMDSNRPALYLGQSTSSPARTRFADLARAAGATVVDTEPLIRAHIAQSSLKLDVGPYDGHLNKLGVRLIANAAANALIRPWE
jgi:hypothetical protein